MNTGKVRVWDAFVRVFHWSLASLFLVAYLSGDDGGGVHVYAGYGILGLIAARLVWGFVGGRHARFSDFLRSPAAALRYLKGLVTGTAPRTLGHNPAGGWMAMLLLVALLATGASGLVLYGLEGEGPLAGSITADSLLVTAVAPFGEAEEEEHDDDHDDDEDDEAATYAGAGGAAMESAEEAWEEVHEFLANATLFLVILHLLGVLASSLAHGENLVRSMITGYKRA